MYEVFDKFHFFTSNIKKGMKGQTDLTYSLRITTLL